MNSRETVMTAVQKLTGMDKVAGDYPRTHRGGDTDMRTEKNDAQLQTHACKRP